MDMLVLMFKSSCENKGVAVDITKSESKKKNLNYRRCRFIFYYSILLLFSKIRIEF